MCRILKIIFLLLVLCVGISGCVIPTNKLQPRKAYFSNQALTKVSDEKRYFIQNENDQKILQKKPTFLLRCIPSSAECIRYLPTFETTLSGKKLQYFLISPLVMDTTIPQIITTKTQGQRRMETYIGTGCDRVPSRAILSKTGIVLIKSCGGEKSLEDLQKALEKLQTFFGIQKKFNKVFQKNGYIPNKIQLRHMPNSKKAYVKKNHQEKTNFIFFN